MTQDLSYLHRQFINVLIILQRPAVQIQLLTMGVLILLAWLLSKYLWRRFQKRFPIVSDFEVRIDEKIARWHYAAAAILRYLLTPILSIIAISLLRMLFVNQGLFAGYFSDGIDLLRAYLFYWLFLITLFVLFPVQSVEHYRDRFFAPLFRLYIIASIIDWFTDLGRLSRIAFIQLFDQPVTLADVFIVIAGSYFWIVGVSILEKLIINFLLVQQIKEDQRAKQAITLILRYFLIALGLVLIFGHVGISTTAIAAITGGLSVGLGFGLKEVINNFVSGVWLLFEGALKPGDIIAIDSQLSEVKELGVRATIVKVIADNSEQIIPNHIFFTQNVTTFTGSDRLIYRSLLLRASYDCDPPQVLNILLQVAAEHPDVLTDPAPVAFATGFGDSSINFELKFWLDDPLKSKRVTSELICGIWETFAASKIKIPYPQHDLYIHNSIELEN